MANTATSNPTLTELAWAAGFLDGEGCITITKRYAKRGNKYYHSVMVTANQINKEPLDKLKKLFGGSVRPVKPIGNRRPSYAWYIYTKSARDMLEYLLPYLTVKKTEANKILELKFDGQALTNEDWVKREETEQWLKDYHTQYTWGGDYHS